VRCKEIRLLRRQRRDAGKGFFGECDLVMLDAVEGFQATGRGDAGVVCLTPLSQNAVQLVKYEPGCCLAACRS